MQRTDERETKPMVIAGLVGLKERAKEPERACLFCQRARMFFLNACVVIIHLQ